MAQAPSSGDEVVIQQEHRRLFNIGLDELFRKKIRTTMLTREQINDRIYILKNHQILTRKKTSEEYKWLKIYSIFRVGDVENLTLKKSMTNATVDDQINIENILQIACREDLFDIICKIHRELGHAGCRITWNNLNEKYSNIARDVVDTFIDLCTCKMGKRQPARATDVTPIISKSLNCRGQVDLIDMQSNPCKDYNWILNYQDHLTKFNYLRPLKRKQAALVAYELLKIFTIQGAPYILQSDNGKEFVAEIIKELGALWPDLKLVHGRHPQSQGSIERSNMDIEMMLGNWMRDNKSKNWVMGLNFVQLAKNNRLHSGVGQVPYILQYGQHLRVGLKQLPLPVHLLHKLVTEEDLDAAMNTVTTVTATTNIEEEEEHSFTEDDLLQELNDDLDEPDVLEDKEESAEERNDEEDAVDKDREDSTEEGDDEDDEENEALHNDSGDTPRRGAIRARASGRQVKQGNTMRKRCRQGTIDDLPVGTVMHVA